ncbi:MAG TPA: glycosyltransferase, partial [Dongiaceae bacterium]|nr:glycosyltransferase [Dongiaceae bacterium]
MRIGIVSQSYYPRYGGVTEHVHALAVELRRRGHDVTIITSRFRKGETGETSGVRRIGYNILVPFNRAFVDFTIGWGLKGQLKRAIRELELDVVHVHCPTAPTLPV